jgi:hypothetical protein
MNRVAISSALALGLFTPASAGAALVSARRVAGTGDPVSGGSSYGSELAAKFTVDGELGVLSRVAPSYESALAIEHTIVWNSADWSEVPWNAAQYTDDWALGSGEDFLVRPRLESLAETVIFGPTGRLLGTGDPVPLAPAFTLYQVWDVHLRPGGAGSFLGRFDSTGDGFADYSVLWRVDDSALSNPEVVLEENDTVDGVDIRTIHTHDISDDGTHWIVSGGTGTLYMVLADDQALAVEGQPSAGAPGRSWGQLASSIAIDDAGRHAFSGYFWNSSDAFMAFDGQVVLMESDMLETADLEGSPAPTLVLSNGGILLHRWDDALFFTCDPADPQTSSTLLLRDGDEVDLDGDRVPEGAVVELDTIDMRDDGSVLVSATIAVDPYDWPEIVLGFDVSCCGNGFVEGTEDCDGGPGCSERCELGDGGSTTDGGSDGTADAGEGSGEASSGSTSEPDTTGAGTTDATTSGEASTAASEAGSDTGNGDETDANESSDANGCSCRSQPEAPLGVLLLVPLLAAFRRDL